MKQVLLSVQTSRRNKMALLAECKCRGLPVEYRWQGEPYQSRLEISFGRGPWQACKSYDEDIRPLLKDK